MNEVKDLGKETERSKTKVVPNPKGCLSDVPF